MTNFARLGRREFLLGASAFFLAGTVSYAAARDTLLLAIYGQSNAIDVGGGRSSSPMTHRQAVPDALMFNGGPETLETSPQMLVPFDQGARERASTSLMFMANALGLLHGMRPLVDQPGRSGASFAALGPGSVPFKRLIEDHFAAQSLCEAEGSTLHLAPLFLIGGEQDMRLGTDREKLVRLLLGLVQGLRSETASLDGGRDRPVFSWQPSSHVRLRGKTRSGEDPAETALGLANAARSISNFFVTHPGYTSTYFDGVHLDASGHRHCGLMFAKAWSAWKSSGTWRPLEPTQALRVGQRQVRVHFHVPTPPLQFEITRVRPLADGAKGVEIWTDSGRSKLSIESVEIDGPTSIVVNTSDILADRGLLRIAYDTDAPPPGPGERHDLRAGPVLGARSNLCDSDPATADLSDALGNSFDLRNFCLTSELPIVSS